MNKSLPAALLAMLGVAACSQFTTSKEERAELQQATDAAAAGYLECIKREALLYVDSETAPEFIVDAVRSRCDNALNSYVAARKAYLETEVMLVEKPLEASVQELQQQARTLVAQEAVRTGSTSLATAAASAAATAPAQSVRQRAAAGVGVQPGAPIRWSSEQRVYLDCMAEQAKRYARVQESAEVIAEVAAATCQPYLTSTDTAALLAEGRTRLLRTVLDARVDPVRR
jgi:hypothetical protein